MTVSVTHATVATLPDQAGAEINKDEWNEAHTVSGLGDLAELDNIDGMSPNLASLLVDSRKDQGFLFQLTNTGGTIQHCIKSMFGSSTAAGYADKITGASATLTNTPTVSGGTGFTTGAGITGHIIVLNTAAQDGAKFLATSNTEYYDGNVQAVYASPTFTSRDVNGTTRVRLEIALTNPMTGAAWTINTTNLPTGKTLLIRFRGFLA